MKISDLIKELEDVRSKHGELETSISCDPQNHRDGCSSDDKICITLWYDQNSPDNPTHLMLCDLFTHQELNDD